MTGSKGLQRLEGTERTSFIGLREVNREGSPEKETRFVGQRERIRRRESPRREDGQGQKRVLEVGKQSRPKID